jgi:hypothetical protein
LSAVRLAEYHELGFLCFDAVPADWQRTRRGGVSCNSC